jgi:hypothetical protein
MPTGKLGKINSSEHNVRYLPTKKGVGRPKVAEGAEALAPISPFSIVPMTYNGGGILATPEIVALYWGNFAAADITSMQTWFAGWAGYISGANAPAGQDQVILQYGVFAASVGVHYNETSAPATATDASAKSKVIALQAAGHLPAFAANRIFVVMTKGITFADYGSVWCAYHGEWAANSYYAICPYPAAGGCEPTATPLGNLQYAVSHEIMEAATDPDPGTGWVEGGGEGGDGCNQQTVNMPFGVLQRYADNIQNACSVWTAHNDQSNWRWCHKCQGMYFAGNSAGVCKAGGSHDHTGSGNYRISQNLTVPYGQTNWRWCHKCQGMYFAGNSAGVCPAGTTHDHAGSGNYNLVHDRGNFAGQSNWRWCHKCQGLYFAGNSAGVCPAGAGHDHTGSGDYILRQG